MERFHTKKAIETSTVQLLFNDIFAYLESEPKIKPYRK